MVPRASAIVACAMAATVGFTQTANAALITTSTEVSAPTATKSERVGNAVAVSDDDTIAFVGGSLSAYRDASLPGSVRVYTSSGPGTAWALSQTLTASDATKNDQFGARIALEQLRQL